MSRTVVTTKRIGFLFFAQCIALVSMGQVKYAAFANIHSVVSGTSTLHAWNMKTSTGECKATFIVSDNERLTGLTSLSLSIPASSLKSDSKSMDKNAYKALKVRQNAAITFTLTSATVGSDGSLKCLGKLSIAGTTVDAELSAVAKLNADRTIDVRGSKKISMKEFNMVPPTFMLGTIKTGNDITLDFDLTLAKL